MKRISNLLILLICFSTSIYGQAEKVRSAEKSLKSQQYEEALDLIEAAVRHPKTKDNPKAWYTRMNVIGTLITNRPMGVADTAKIDLIMSSYDQVAMLDQTEDKYFTQLADIYLKNLNNQFLNKGVTSFQQAAYNQSYDWFIKCQKIVPNDTLAYLYAGINAQSMDRMDLLRINYSKLVELGSNTNSVYKILIGLETTETQDYAKALEIAQLAKSKFPNDNEFRKQEINALLLMGRQSEALEGLLAAVEREPNNANLLFNLGFLYETQKQFDQAVAYYKKSLDANPNYFEAVYNLGTYYYNLGVQSLKDLNDLSIEEYKLKGEELKQKVNDSFLTSLPYFEKSVEIRPEEPVLWNTLSNIYGRLKMEDKEIAAFNKYKELRGN